MKIPVDIEGYALPPGHVQGPQYHTRALLSSQHVCPYSKHTRHIALLSTYSGYVYIYSILATPCPAQVEHSFRIQPKVNDSLPVEPPAAVDTVPVQVSLLYQSFPSSQFTVGQETRGKRRKFNSVSGLRPTVQFSYCTGWLTRHSKGQGALIFVHH